MIQLTRLNGASLVLNSDLVKLVEQAPDTVITLTSGEKIIVRESAPEIIERIIEFRRSVLHGIAVCDETRDKSPCPLEHNQQNGQKA